MVAVLAGDWSSEAWLEISSHPLGPPCSCCILQSTNRSHIVALAFLSLLAAWAILTGILEIVAPASFPMNVAHAKLMVLTGAVSVIFGMFIAAQPASGLLTVAWLIGVYAVVLGVMYIVMYFQSRSLASSLA
jgi:uncharacterized membrane protein HdeD (DUF308 family)